MNVPPYPCIIEDSSGTLYQYVPPMEAVLTDPGMPGRELPVKLSRIGGWSDMRCRPVDGRAIVPPVRVVWRTPEEAPHRNADADNLRVHQ